MKYKSWIKYIVMHAFLLFYHDRLNLMDMRSYWKLFNKQNIKAFQLHKFSYENSMLKSSLKVHLMRTGSNHLKWIQHIRRGNKMNTRMNYILIETLNKLMRMWEGKIKLWINKILFLIHYIHLARLTHSSHYMKHIHLLHILINRFI